MIKKPRDKITLYAISQSILYILLMNYVTYLTSNYFELENVVFDLTHFSTIRKFFLL